MPLPNKVNTPPGGWAYRIPETGKTIGGCASLTQLLGRVREHYRAAGYAEPKDLEAKIEAYICNTVEGYCSDEFGRTPLTISEQMSHSFHAVLQGTATLVSWVAGGSERVSQEQAELRAKVCVGCEHNLPPVGCTGCNIGALQNLVNKIVGGRKTSVDEQLKACNVCSCGLRAKVHLPHATIWPHMSEKQRSRLPDFCWLKLEAK